MSKEQFLVRKIIDNTAAISSNEDHEDFGLPDFKSLLIGSSSEREALKDEIDNASKESLKSDEVEIECRKAKVLPFPSTIDHPTTVIQVTHILLRVVSRIFKDVSATVENSYDWIGSLAEVPEIFY